MGDSSFLRSFVLDERDEILFLKKKIDAKYRVARATKTKVRIQSKSVSILGAVISV